MFDTSQRVDPDTQFPALAAAIAALPAVQPGGPALEAARELRALVALQRRLADQLRLPPGPGAARPDSASDTGTCGGDDTGTRDRGGMTGDTATTPPGKARSGPGAWLAGGRLAAVFGDASSHRQLLGSHAELTLEALTRLGCDAHLALAIMNADGQPLYLSRDSRDPNTAQRRILVVRDGGCVFPGCDRPPAHCQAHHVKFWTRDLGPTDIDNLALVCGFHHWLIHDKHWTLAALPPSPETPAGGWHAQSPDGLQLTTQRKPAD